MTTSPQHARSGLDELAVLRARVAEMEAERLAQGVATSPGGGVNRQLVDSMLVGVVQVGLDGALQYVNAEGQRILGLTYDQFTSKYVSDFQPLTIREDGSPLPMAEYPVTRCLQTGKAQPPMTIGVQTPTGRFSWAVYNAAPLVDSQTGAMTAVVVTFVDITPFRQARAALKESEQRFTALADNSVVGFWQVTGDGATLYINPAMCRMLDIDSLDDLKGRSFREFFTGPSLEIMKHEHAKRPSGESSSYEVELVSRTGVHRQVIISGAPVFHAEGRLHSMIGTFIDITERTRARNALALAEQRLRTVIDAAPLVLWATDADGAVTLSEGKALEGLGFRPGQLVGANVFEMYRDRPDIIDVTRRVLLQGEDVSHVTVLGDVTLESRMSPLRDEHGRITGSIGVAVDISDRQRAEQALWLSQQRLTSMVKHTPLAVIVWNLKFEVVEWNPAAERIFGYSADEAVARHASFIIPPRARVHVDDVLNSLLKQAGGVRSTNPNVTKDGREIFCEWYNSPLMDPDGRMVGVASLCEDVTERLMSETALKNSEERLRSVFDSAVDPLWDWDIVNDRTTFSPSWPRLLGYRVGELDQSSDGLTKLIHPDDLAAVTTRLQTCLKGERPDFEAEYRVRTRSGGWIWALSRGRVVLRDAKHRAVRMIGSFSDISERKRNEQKLRESYDFQRLMLNELDHRVRNNLASLSALIDLTARGTSDVRELARSIKGRVQGMTSVHSLLSRGHWHPIPLRDLLLAMTPTDVRQSLDIEGPEVLVGHRQVTALGMIFQELLANSLKYGALGDRHGRVAVIWSVDSARADLSQTIPLNLTWKETGGPPPAAAPALKPGVGTGLIEGLTRAELRGQADLRFPPQGALHTFTMAFDRTAGTAATAS